MTTATQICNIALGWLGANRITSLDVEENSKEWLLCSENFDTLRDAVLEEREWTFAITRVDLDPSNKTIVFGFGHLFEKPSDSLRILTVHDDSVIRPQPITTPQPVSRGVHDLPQLEGWQVEGNFIIANAELIHVRYNKRVTEVGKFSATFTQALAQRLAAEFALPLTESRSLFDKMWSAYAAKIAMGSVLDGIQGRTRKVRSQALIRRR